MMHNDTRSVLERVFFPNGQIGLFFPNCLSLAHIPFFVVVQHTDAYCP